MIFRHALAVAMMAALAGCGGGSPADGANEATAAPAGSANKADACSLVTAEEVGVILGEAIVATEPGEGSCEYQTADAGASSVTIELDQGDAAGAMNVARRAAGTLKDIGASAAGEGAAGAEVNAMLSESAGSPKVGDEAFFGPNSQLSVRKGNSYIAVTPPIMRSRMAAGNPMLSAEEKRKMALALAEKALSRLP